MYVATIANHRGPKEKYPTGDYLNELNQTQDSSPICYKNKTSQNRFCPNLKPKNKSKSQNSRSSITLKVRTKIIVTLKFNPFFIKVIPFDA